MRILVWGRIENDNKWKRVIYKGVFFKEAIIDSVGLIGSGSKEKLQAEIQRAIHLSSLLQSTLEFFYKELDFQPASIP